tara:strand:+ start:115325 stop:115618 length:294 start_codon:yes stop_codon:yes gene_type:complete
MVETTISKVSPNELVELINAGIKEQLQAFTARINSKVQTDERPHLTKKETAKFFDVSVNCITDWSNKGILTPHKVGQRVYFSKEECIRVMFNQSKTA